jgi:hypothetical protein
LLDGHTLTSGLSWDDAEGTPELRVPLDSLGGEKRNTDLAIVAPWKDTLDGRAERRVAISIEAKADESFGQRVSAAIASAEKRRASGKDSYGDQRARRLARVLLGEAPEKEPAIGDLRYQLRPATAGALNFAKRNNAAVAVLVVHEFVDPAGRHTRESLLTRNANELDAFIRCLTRERITGVRRGEMVGPVRVHGDEDTPSTIDLLIGKVRTTTQPH